MARPKVIWYRPFVPDILGGTAVEMRQRCRVAVTVHRLNVSVVIPGPFCVEAGSVFAAGPAAGDVETESAGQVGC